MHEAKLSGAKGDADNRRTEEGILRAANLNTSFERISRPRRVSPVRIHARSTLEPSKVIQRTTKQRPLFRTVISSVIFELHCGSEAGSSSYFESACGSEAGSSSHFERHCGSGQARAAISSAPAAPSGLEQPFRAPSDCGAVNSGVFEALGCRVFCIPCQLYIQLSHLWFPVVSSFGFAHRAS